MPPVGDKYESDRLLLVDRGVFRLSVVVFGGCVSDRDADFSRIVSERLSETGLYTQETLGAAASGEEGAVQATW